MRRFDASVCALVAWYSLLESDSIHDRNEMTADDRQELLSSVIGHLDTLTLSADLSSLLTMVRVGALNDDSGYKQKDLIGSLSICAELAQLIFEVERARIEAELSQETL